VNWFITGLKPHFSLKFRYLNKINHTNEIEFFVKFENSKIATILAEFRKMVLKVFDF